jgi:glycosyltransferase involved in cell wall biosynthesis
MKAQRSHIAILGHRGIPGNYGGFETFAEELATRLVADGHQVDVYCRTNTGTYRKPTYKGVKLFYLNTVSNKFLDTLVHTTKAVLHATFVRRPDLILMVNVGNAIVSWIPRLFGIPVVLNVDGLEWERRKWNWLARTYLRTSAWLTRWLPSAIVTDAKVIYDHYQERLGISSTMIPYGAVVQRKRSPDVLRTYGLKANEYYLYVARFEPENNPLQVVQAFEQVKTNKKLVMVGGAPYASSYIKEIRRTRDPRIVFLGFVFGKEYKALQQQAYAYIQATEVGGTHPALIEAMGFGNCVLINGTPENMETANGSAIPFWFYRGHRAPEGLTSKIQLIEDKPELVPTYRRRAAAHIRRNYRWDVVTQQYQDLFEQILARKILVPVVESRHA